VRCRLERCGREPGDGTVESRGDADRSLQTLSAVRDPHGTVVGVSQIDRDMRERKRREDARAERERRPADLYDHSPDMFAFVELHSGRIVEFNNTCQPILTQPATAF
jgi:PAS domain-containing protein